MVYSKLLNVSIYSGYSFSKKLSISLSEKKDI